MTTFKSNSRHTYLITVMVTSDTPVNYTPFEDTIVAGRVVGVVENGKPNERFGLSPDPRALSNDEE